MSPIKPRGPAVPPSPSKAEDVDQTIAEPPRDFTDEIFRELVGNAPPPPPRPLAGAPPPPLEPVQLGSTVPLEIAHRSQLSNTKPMVGAPPHPSAMPVPPPLVAPPSGPAVQIQSAPLSAPSIDAPQESEIRVRTPLWAILYLVVAVLAIAFGLFVLFTQSRVVGHF